MMYKLLNGSIFALFPFFLLSSSTRRRSRRRHVSPGRRWPRSWWSGTSWKRTCANCGNRCAGRRWCLAPPPSPDLQTPPPSNSRISPTATDSWHCKSSSSGCLAACSSRNVWLDLHDVRAFKSLLEHCPSVAFVLFLFSSNPPCPDWARASQEGVHKRMNNNNDNRTYWSCTWTKWLLLVKTNNAEQISSIDWFVWGEVCGHRKMVFRPNPISADRIRPIVYVQSGTADRQWINFHLCSVTSVVLGCGWLPVECDFTNSCDAGQQLTRWLQ